ncbi:hypothetical protein [Parabacteroides pacaensis]|uniref:hypothetical protein n=1 Tax=Parabacteroides pacaensis TaxID=2086575 RepID=UPI000D1014FC|nr:hypothetical protein [Parabacteroides pacaensis]
MDILAAYKIGITVLIPVFSAITCFVLVALSLRDCLTQEERRLKKVMLVYLSLSALGWYMAFCYEFHPVLFTWLNVLCLVSFVLPSIFFYRIVRYLTRLGKAERFSWLHYLLPALLAGVLFVWSLFVPMDVQIEIVGGKALVFPAGYETFTRFFTLKPLLRVVFGMVYYILTIAVLVQFYQKTSKKKTPVRRTAGWVVFLVGISIASLLSSLLPTFMPRATILHSVWTLLAAAAIAIQHVLLSYHIIRRKYRLYAALVNASVQSPVAALEAALGTAENTEENPEATPEPEPKPQRRQHNGMLERKHFEAYFREEKPWLNPGCKIADLVEVFDVNRTAISAFINRTYGMNFNRYLNSWRIKEFDRLRALPSNQGKSMRSLVEKAGFDNYRTYLRAVAAERESAEEKHDKKKGGTP